jgi:hypothetical protein
MCLSDKSTLSLFDFFLKINNKTKVESKAYVNYLESEIKIFNMTIPQSNLFMWIESNSLPELTSYHFQVEEKIKNIACLKDCHLF